MRTVDKISLVDKKNEMDEESSSEYEKYYVESGEQPKMLKWIINSIIILMITILITSILSTMALHIICSNFDWLNIFSVKLQFGPKNPKEVDALLQKINSDDFRIESLTATESKFVYEDDRLINLEDLKYLVKMQVDKASTYWNTESAISYMLRYPEVSEAMSIIWLILTIIYQCGVKESNWGIPQGWRIVVPSIFIYFIMSILTITLSVLGSKSMSRFCVEIKKNLIEPDVVRCGLAIAHLRLQRKSHDFVFDTILNVYNHMNYAKSFCWLLAFILIILRFLFAIDFQLIELKMTRYDKPKIKPIKIKRTDSFGPLPGDIEIVKNTTIYDSSNLNDFNTKNEEKPDIERKLGGDDKRIKYNALKTEDDDEIEDFQSASSIMVRTPLMGSGEIDLEKHTSN